jgi:hypothetical protein
MNALEIGAKEIFFCISESATNDGCMGKAETEI